MKRLVTIAIVFVLIMCGYAWAQTNANQTSTLNSDQLNIMQGQGFANADAQGGDADSSSGALSYLWFNPITNSVVEYPEYRVGAVGIPPSPSVWPFPQSPPTWFWNAFPNGLDLVYQRQWTLKNVNASLERISPNGLLEFVGCVVSAVLGGQPEEGKGFEWEISLSDYKLRPSTKLNFATIVQDINVPLLLQNYTCIGAFNVKGCEERSIDQTIRCAVKLALRYDLDLGFLRFGLNPVNSSSSISPGIGWNAANVTNNLALVTSLSGGKAVVRGEPCAILYAFRKNGVSQEAKEIAEQLAKPLTEKTTTVVPVPAPPKDEELLKKGEVNGKLRSQAEEQRNKSEERSEWVDPVDPTTRSIWRRASGG